MGLKLNLGDGGIPVPGYTGLDIKHGHTIYPLPFDDETVDEIRASHVLEHFGHHQIADVLAEWVRVLKCGGILKVAVPDFAKIAKWYREDRPSLQLQSYIVGGQTDEYDYHKSVFDKVHLERCLKAAGLRNIRGWISEVNDNASDEVSLNMQGTRAYPPAKEPWPASEAKNVYSQFGEDGILDAIFNKIGTTHGICVDVGASDGTLFSNVRQWIERGWNGILIEADEDRYKALCQQPALQSCHRIHTKVQPNGDDSLDAILTEMKVPEDFDLLNIDIDGQEFFVWNSLLKFKPRVVVVEYNPLVDPLHIPVLGAHDNDQAGSKAMAYIAAARGYVCVARTKTNLVCVRREIAAEHSSATLADPPNEDPKPEAIERAVEQPVQEEPARIEPVQVVAVASVPRLGFNDNWHCTIRALMALGIKIEMVTGVFWGQCLTRGIEKAIAGGAEQILTIDYDSVFDVQHVAKLCQLLADQDEYDAIVPVQARRENQEMLFKMNGSWDFKQPLTNIASGHFGLTVFEAKAFAKLNKPWFQDQPDPEGGWNDGRTDCDIHFWNQWRMAGLKIGLANEVRIGHLELLVSWPTMDFKKKHQSISDYRRLGQPAECGGGLKVELGG